MDTKKFNANGQGKAKAGSNNTRVTLTAAGLAAAAAAGAGRRTVRTAASWQMQSAGFGACRKSEAEYCC